MREHKINPLGFFGLLGLLGVVGFLTNDKLELFWLAWFSWFGYFRRPVDERFYKNISKSGLLCFFITIAGLSIIYIMRNFHVNSERVFSVIGLLFAVILICFPVSLGYFERQGD